MHSRSIRRYVLMAAGAALLALAIAGPAVALNSKQTLGKHIYFDPALSEPSGLSCAGCHWPSAGWADPDQDLPVSAGIVDLTYGGRNAPTSGYAATSPTFFFCETCDEYIGGQFWDGRAATLADQAKGPFLNPVEMANPNKSTVVRDVAASDYASLFLRIYGAGAFDDVDAAYDDIADAIAAYERSSELNSYSSTYDAYLAGKAVLTAQEKQGLSLFKGKAGCTGCHGRGALVGGKDPFTTHKYANLGVPSNPDLLDLLQLPDTYADPGLGGYLQSVSLPFVSENWGKVKIPTLRNVAASGPYTHNGYFTSLHDMVTFLNTRDVSDAYLPPETPLNVTTKVGDLGLTESQVDAIVAFLGTLTDASLDAVQAP